MLSFGLGRIFSKEFEEDEYKPFILLKDDERGHAYSPTRYRSEKKLLRTLIPTLGFIGLLVFTFLAGYQVGSGVTTQHVEDTVSNPVNDSDQSNSSIYPVPSTINETSVVETTEEAYTYQERERPLITYVYFETENARENALFFMAHGLHAEADFIIILNGETDLEVHIPTAPNIQVIHRNNTCFDLGTHAEILTADNKKLMNKYNRFIMMNSSIRGPFLPTWSDECWSDAYLDRVSDSTKLVGMTMKCNADGGKRKIMQSMLFATDRIGLQTLLPITNHCFEKFWDAVQAEEYAAQTVLDAGYDISVLMTSFSSNPDYVHTCTHGEVLGNNWYFGTNLHPYETIFQKANRNIAPRQLELLTIWHHQANYSSWDACSAKRRRERGSKARSLELH
ncbi:hypothetical protein TWF694_009410 [Orbilia ellipsospora]|uniref:Uncharacterized protein n=1 Tax=Orbilia ellipsospora TaxID=2528407 RepID=A0AAV9XC24_9PEZI